MQHFFDKIRCRDSQQEKGKEIRTDLDGKYEKERDCKNYRLWFEVTGQPIWNNIALVLKTMMYLLFILKVFC